MILVGATNFPWLLDDALKRRLEKRVYIPLPDDSGRRALLDINLREMKGAQTFLLFEALNSICFIAHFDSRRELGP